MRVLYAHYTDPESQELTSTRTVESDGIFASRVHCTVFSRRRLALSCDSMLKVVRLYQIRVIV